MTQAEVATPSHETLRPQPTSGHLPPGDRVVRPPRDHRVRGLRKVLGAGALYSIGYGNLGSSIYYVLGITAAHALGATPLVLAAAGLLFFFTACTYAEGSAMIPEAGGASAFARRGLGDLPSFVAGWVLILDYIVIIALAAATVPSYLGYFFPVLKQSGQAAAWVAVVAVLALMVLNVIGVRATTGVNLLLCVVDLLTQGTLLVLGCAFLLNGKALAAYMRPGSPMWPSADAFAYGISIAMVAYIGVESISQMAAEARNPGRSVPRAMLLAVLSSIVAYGGIALVAVSALGPVDLGTLWMADPIAGIVFALPTLAFESSALTLRVALNHLMAPWVAVLATAILLMAINAGILGISRLAFAMGAHHQLPAAMVRLHRRFRTPYIAVIFFSAVAIALLVPGFYGPGAGLRLGDLYGFGAMLAFTISHVSIIALRVREPDLPRPFRPRGDISVAGHRIPAMAVLGCASTLAVWLVVVFTHRWGRTVGLVWLLGGAVIYAAYRRRRGLAVWGGGTAVALGPPHADPTPARQAP